MARSSTPKTAIGSLPDHKFVEFTKQTDDYARLPEITNASAGFGYLLDVFVDNYIALVIPTS